MNKAELVAQIAANTNTTKSQAEKILDATLKLIKKSVKKGEQVKLVGFGTFDKQKHKSRVARNPQTGKNLQIPSLWHPKFRPSSGFKNLLR